MSAHANPDITTDGLVFMYDTGSGKSYKGEPTENVVANPLPTAGWVIANAQGSAITRTYLEEDGKPFMRFSGVTNGSDYPRITNSAFANSATITGTFSTSLEVRGTDDAVLRFRIYENGSTKITNSITLTSEWTRYTFDNQTTGFNLNQPYFNPATSNATYDIRNIQVEAKGHSTPFVDGTRSATAGLLDLTKNATIDLSNASFDSNAQMVFDGTDDRIYTSEDISFGNNTTWEAWVNRTSSVNSINMFMGRFLPYFGLRNNDILFSNSINSTQRNVYSTGFTPSNGTWYHLTFTTEYDGTNTTSKIYINGVLNNSGSFTGSQTQHSQGFAIGDGRDSGNWYPFNGKVSNVKIYDKTLTAAEVLQNFNATKSRFSL
jgi:hypothetical protein